MKFLQLVRLKQWIKNILVIAAPIAAGNFFNTSRILHTLVAFFSFCFIASAGYIVNDLKDVEQDRKNPKKISRPIASGQVSSSQAVALFWVLLAFGLLLALTLPRSFLICAITYFLLTLLYSLHFKHEPVVELIIVSFGFTLRAIGGACATDTPTSKWFLMVATFAPLVILTSKRISESKNVSHENLRPVMKKYSTEFLQFALTLSAGVTISSYGLWAFSITEVHPYAQLSVITVTVQLFRYVWIAESGRGEIPEDLFFQDQISRICMVVTAALLLLSIYAK